MVIKTLSGQSIWDIALQYCGKADAAFSIARLNNINLTDNLPALTMLELPEIIHNNNVKYFVNNRITPSTGLHISNNIPQSIFSKMSYLNTIADDYNVAGGDVVFTPKVQVSTVGIAYIQAVRTDFNADDAKLYAKISADGTNFSDLVDPDTDELIEVLLDESSDGLILKDLVPGTWLGVGFLSGSVTEGLLTVKILT